MELNEIGDKCKNTALDFSSLPARDTSFVGSNLIEIESSLAFPKAIDGLILRFPIPASKLMIDPLQVFLCLELYVMDVFGKKIPDEATPVAVECGIGGIIIDKAELWNQGQPKKEWSNMGLLYHVSTMLSHGIGYFESLGTATRFIPDRGDVSTAGRWTENTGLDLRRELVARSAKFDVVSRLFIPAWLQEKLIPSETQDWTIVLHLNSSGFVLTRAEKLKRDFRLFINSASLRMNMIELKESALKEFETKLYRDERLLYTFIDYDLHSFFLNQGLQQKTTPQGSLPKHPSRVAVFFISAAALAGDQTRCSFYYNNYNVERVVLRLGDKVWSMTDLDFTLGNKGCAWAYFNSVYRGLSQINSDFGFNLQEFRNIYSILVFDVTPTGMGMW